MPTFTELEPTSNSTQGNYFVAAKGNFFFMRPSSQLDFTMHDAGNLTGEVLKFDHVSEQVAYLRFPPHAEGEVEIRATYPLCCLNVCSIVLYTDSNFLSWGWYFFLNVDNWKV